VSSPAQVLGYPLGSRFTPHHRILAALDALASTSARVAQFEYGRSTEGRPLRLAESIAIARRRFWPVLGAQLLLGLITSIVTWVAALGVFAAFGLAILEI